MGSSPTRGIIKKMYFSTKPKLLKVINENFFRKWNSEMSYVLGYVVADGNISTRKKAKYNPFILNLTSSEKKHLQRIRKALNSKHKIGTKPGGSTQNIAYQIQISNPKITNDLIRLGIRPRKTYNLSPIKVLERYLPDFIRGYFDGDGTVYIYKVNKVPQIKSSFGNINFPFIKDLNRRLCRNLAIPLKTIHKERSKDGIRYVIDFYIDDCKKLAEFMYRDNPILYLPRKRRVFEKWKLIKRRDYIKQNYPSKIGWYLNQKMLV